ncbi:hypothetical protein [Clostridium massiliamazoniense]|uniref:hypothetical protein n=1 Tax=Clostridium massiliamazoniense TaxID=1347366 RepID=UPI000AE42649|nr:hypothetical protein [Clostridium massiliamazoniense]
MKIPVSFKKNEQYIYDYVMKKLSASVYIKELIIADMKRSKIDSININQTNNNNFDF